MIQLDSNYSIETDANNFTLKYKDIYYDEVKEKNATSKQEWYCADLAHALNIYMNECLKPCENIKALKEELIRVEKVIMNLRVEKMKVVES